MLFSRSAELPWMVDVRCEFMVFIPVHPVRQISMNIRMFIFTVVLIINTRKKQLKYLSIKNNFFYITGVSKWMI